MSTRNERREAEKALSENEQIYYDYFMSLLHNSVKFEGLGDTPKRYIMRELIAAGSIAYDKITGLYLRYNGTGVDIYGLPNKYQLFGYNGFSVWRKPKDVVILRINDRSTALYPFIEKQSKLLADLDSFLTQNLDACRTMTVVEIDDPSQGLSALNEANARRVGAALIIKNKNAMKGSELKATTTGAQWLVDQVQQVRMEIINETLQRLGISTANTSKRERVQGMEVAASQGAALDSIYVMCDTFNYDAEQGGLSVRMIPNTSLTVESNEVVDEFKEGGLVSLNPVEPEPINKEESANE